MAYRIVVHGILPEQRCGFIPQFFLDNLILNFLLQQGCIVHTEFLFQIIRHGLLGSLLELSQNKIRDQLADFVFILIDPLLAVIKQVDHQSIQGLIHVQIFNNLIQPFLNIFY